jgi:hypothetical protein
MRSPNEKSWGTENTEKRREIQSLFLLGALFPSVLYAEL